mmetsp:Transcript_62576/g.202880  ORF Transcript_62576/g.202880 Transcript_62576/m.202880 type:complete len:274 (+) Transcript_62576:182-1003(+)
MQECRSVAELAVRSCSRPRAPRTCARTRGRVDNETSCVWLHYCMRCVPFEGALNETCIVDGVIFNSLPLCPAPVNEARCGGCVNIELQELCIGLCSKDCKWANVSWMRGRRCSLRVEPEEVVDNTFMIVLSSIGGFFVLIVLSVGCRWFLAMRRRAREQAEVRRMTRRMTSQKNRALRGSMSRSYASEGSAEDGGLHASSREGQGSVHDSTGSAGSGSRLEGTSAIKLSSSSNQELRSSTASSSSHSSIKSPAGSKDAPEARRRTSTHSSSSS